MTIRNNLKHLVFKVPDFATPEFCAGLIQRADVSGFTPATITTECGACVDHDIRNNQRAMFNDPVLAASLWQKARALFSRPFQGHRATGLNERFRVYRNGIDQYFDWHQDGTFQSQSGARSLFTMMIYLNDTCEGGGTTFADVFSPYMFSDFTISPKEGKALFFHHPVSHRGGPVVSGEKFVLRTDVMFEAES